MTIVEHRGKHLVTIRRKAALPGYQRIRKYVDDLEQAKALEVEIEEAIETYGKWPVEPTDKPFRVAATKGIRAETVKAPSYRSGTLREATELTISGHWRGMRCERNIAYVTRSMVRFFENRGCPDIDDITSEDIDAYVDTMRARDLTPSTMNECLGGLRTINKTALNRLPPLATVTLPIPHIKGGRKQKWWLRPDDHIRVVTALRDPIDGSLPSDPLFADLLDVICYMGLRIEEALRLEPYLIRDLDKPEPWLQTPGTKTVDAQNSIPIFPAAVPVLKSAIDRAKANRWTYLFPLRQGQTADKWNIVREYLGASDIPTATLKSLRRTFAWYANARGVPTSTLQKLLRHRVISTTAGYLELVGDTTLNDSRRYFSDDSTTRPTEAPRTTPGEGIGAIIQAYASTPGVTPEQVARFAKEMMT